ncbi:MAG: hypothetical protein JW726_20175 [Anaerolineales bacterium]|nr:hypothetical protein [Anaerolineales bacterium]
MLSEISLYPLSRSANGVWLETTSTLTLLAISHSIEDTVIQNNLGGVFYAGFQRFSAFLPQVRRFTRLAGCGEVLVFGLPDAPVPTIPGITYWPLLPDAPLTREWFLIFEHPAFTAALLTQQLHPSSALSTPNRPRRYQGGVSLTSSLVAEARRRLVAALQQPPAAAPQTPYTPSSDLSAQYQRNLVRYLEKRNQQVIKLYHSLAERKREVESLAVLLQQTNQELERKVQARTAELASANQQLQELDALKSAFLGVISHELRTPFSGILFSLQLLESEGETALNPEQQQLLSQLRNGVDSAYAMIENLVNYAAFVRKQGVLHMASTSPGPLLETALRIVQGQSERKGLHLARDIAPDLPEIHCDADRIADALHELLDNAIKFTPTGGTVTLRSWLAESAWHISVSDTGPGIPAELLPNLWQSFAQLADPLRRGREGLGLGLALVDYIVQAHNGQTWVNSQPGQGTTFGFTIPLA